MFSFLKKQDIDKGVYRFHATQGAVLLDVRSAEEYKQGHIPQSINIDVNKIDAAVLVVKDKLTPLFVYCLSGGRSDAAVNALKNMGYKNVTNIGGIRTYTGRIEKGA